MEIRYSINRLEPLGKSKFHFSSRLWKTRTHLSSHSNPSGDDTSTRELPKPELIGKFMMNQFDRISDASASSHSLASTTLFSFTSRIPSACLTPVSIIFPSLLPCLCRRYYRQYRSDIFQGLSSMRNIKSFNSNSCNKIVNNIVNNTVAHDKPQLLQWLSPLQPQKRHKHLCNNRHDGLGEWIFERRVCEIGNRGRWISPFDIL
ncbi:hypothetical protein L873DRAFT_437082 [Choiromyces venosus 120613-1]|uniref:Uncharacterized protein n=1 Tax=Choiromyces venosus 120613-1 TaxID=1336337 RepID=A0A3N4IWA9_9PEZI|nr:hypothetical protein L873DRAFT_437082 [Choiromyces venosus 120613-1]